MTQASRHGTVRGTEVPTAAVVVKRLTIVAAAVVLTAAMAGCTTEHAALEKAESAAVCVAPHVSVDPEIASPRGEVTVRGEAMMNGCADAISVDEQGNQKAIETVLPYTGIDVVLSAGGTESVLATVDADEHGAFEVAVVLPAGTPVGPAEISAGPVWVERAELQVVD